MFMGHSLIIGAFIFEAGSGVNPHSENLSKSRPDLLPANTGYVSQVVFQQPLWEVCYKH